MQIWLLMTALSERTTIRDVCGLHFLLFPPSFCLSCQRCEEHGTSLGFHHARGDFSTDFSLANLLGGDSDAVGFSVRQTDRQRRQVFAKALSAPQITTHISTTTKQTTVKCEFWWM